MFTGFLPARRAASGEVLRNFTPNWFTVTMGTGILALMLPHLPLAGAVRLGEGLWWLNLGLFLLLTVLSLLRLVLYPQESRATLRHPVQSMFLGAVPMGLATLINGLIVFGVPQWGAAAATLARDLWAFDALLAAVVGLLVPYLMFTRQDHALERMTGVWLLPVVASEVAAASAGLIAPQLPVAEALPLLYSGYVLFALSVPLALMIITVLVLRLAQHKLPTPDLGVSMFLPLGPLATGALALLQLGEAAPRVLSAQELGDLAPTFTGLGLAGGLILWGFGAWWLALATLTTGRFVRTGLPFNLGWWGLTFPLGVYTAATYALGTLTRLSAFTTLGHILVGVLAGLWFLVAARTLHGALRGHLFQTPPAARETGLPRVS
ncbi:C4-dicarboxylate transporter/malic acid transport protein (plasmid) [Deinococcus geothermalis DSM 11300]|uniref:C4-dicarboxylate transporter/malic acid transport protein n=1 Tax=Deinococcus geothermalis (strain DSM 11300 / CIP 105573 / AG-3a) TaxID=319795 RepID=Q1J2L6_DEIGD|nr:MULTISPECIES: TDT family transporter [Deinococcus]ABF44268.1 C4-dicarboxylate transporter/malic acid transport protein [Deinococcus geothermalis DSM 11300]MBI0446375.1 C4-dicarboxylate ABC transporter [Deinococcus sp. DB0503]